MEWTKVESLIQDIRYIESEQTIDCTASEFMEVMDKRSKQKPTDKEIIKEISYNQKNEKLTMKIRTRL
jgi:hypothetical protein